MKLEQLETPALILDLDLFEENIDTMKKFINENGLALRPHYKSHKCTYIAHRQIKAGAKGICAAKLGEAEDLVLSGIEDVLIANQVIEPSKIARTAYLAGCCRLTVCVDNEENIAALSAAAALQKTTIYCLIEYEIGMNRCGVKTPEEFLRLAKLIQSSPNLVFEGIQAYAGNLAHIKDYETRKAESEKVEKRVSELKEYVERAGITVKEVSGTSTGTTEFRAGKTVYTEIQAGSYLFMDAAYGALNLTFKNSLFLLSQVISVNPDWIIVDCGMKSASVDQTNPVFRDFPEEPVNLSEEHCAVRNKSNNTVKLGDRLMMIPGHCCTTVNLHDYLYLIRNGKVIDRVSITSRGKSL